MKQPWRAVIHIEDRTGPNGGIYWMLTLECGHLLARRRRRGNPDCPFCTPHFAPNKVRCLACSK